MKRYFILITIAILVLASGLAMGCATTVLESDTQPPQPDAKLMQFRQTKMSELDQLNAELAALQSKIAAKQSEYDELKKLVDVACDRISRILGRPVNFTWYECCALATNDELITYNKMASVSQELARLREQEQPLLFTKQYLEQDINEVRQHKSLMEYHQFKLSQLENLEGELIKMKLDIDQKIMLEGLITKSTPEYKRLLLHRKLLQQDIAQLQQLLH